MIDLVSYALKIVGVVFLVIAAVGVLRLPDAFTRMHAATKAGTLGAGLVVLGSALSFTDVTASGAALVTVLILLATVPLASHLLARAAYTSGAPFWQGMSGDALTRVLPRSAATPAEDAAVDRDRGGDAAFEEVLPQPLAIARVVVAPSHGDGGAAGALAATLARRLDRPIVPLGVIDAAWFEGSEDGIAGARERLQASLDDLERRTRTRAAGKAAEGVGRATGMVQLLEGVPEDLLARSVAATDLLVLSGTGWFDHGAGREPEGISGRAARLLPLTRALRVPVLLAGAPRDIARVTVLDDGGPRIEAALATIAGMRLFGEAEIRVTWRYGEEFTPARRERLQRIAAPLALGFTAPPADPDALRDPGDVLVRTALTGPQLASWYGQDWRARIAPSWQGHLFLVG